MRRCRSVLAFALALILALAPVISPLHINAAESTEVSGDIVAGYDFEDDGDRGHFSGAGRTEDATTIARVAYGTEVTGPTNGGSYGLQLSRDKEKTLSFRIGFGKELAAGTKISFDAYGKITIWGISNNSSWTLKDTSDNPLATDIQAGGWTTVTVTLSEAADHIDLVWTCSVGYYLVRSAALFVDNFKAVEPLRFTGDFWTGVGLEDAGDILQFVGQNSGQDATIERVTYTDADVTAPANGGSYVLKVSHENHSYPTFRVNFNETLPANTMVTFDIYGNYTSDASGKYMKLELYGDSKNNALSEDPNQVVWTLAETWAKATIILTAATDHVDFMYNVADNQHGEVASWMLLDNFKAERLVFTGDFEVGVGLEDAGDFVQFTKTGSGQDATIRRVSYTTVNVTAPANSGSYALKVSHENKSWPTFRVNFGKTLEAGTVVTFNVYGNYTSDASGKYMKLELYGDSKNSATSADPNQVVWTQVDTWATATVTLTADSDYIDFMYNVADGTHGEVASWMLLDNFKATMPNTPVGDILVGYGFEVDGNQWYFEGIEDNQAAILERVSYADANVTAPENGSSYALKASHASDCWPHFRLNFGKTLKPGTTVTFDIFGNYTSDASDKYMKLELAGDSKNYAQSAVDSHVVWTLAETWAKATITLTAATDHVDFMYNVADGQHGNPSSWMLMDNFKATEPVPVGDIWEGYGFEVDGNQWYFDALGGDYADRDATFAVVSYANAGIDAPQNGGSNVLRLTHTSNQWPTFRLYFSEKLYAGTVITFDAYTRDTSNASKNTISVFEYVSGGDATEEYFYNSWNKLSIVLKSDCDYIDLFCNIDRRITIDSANIEVYLDNFKAVKIEPVGDILEGYGFEKYGNAGYYTGLGMANRDATIERVAYNELDISAPANGGSYALKLSNPSDRYPTFRINFGKTLHAGAEITFHVYLNVKSASQNIPSKFEFIGDSGSGDATTSFDSGVWVERRISLTSDADHIDLFWNIENDGLVEPFASEIYLDNIIASDPLAPVGNILVGYGFEVDGNDRYFNSDSTTIESVTYADANVTAPANSGASVLKLSHTSSSWPNFRINFGRTLRAGTIITFDIYGNYTSDASGKYMKLEIANTSKNFATSADPNQVVRTNVETWQTATITLTAESDYVDLFYNVADGNHGNNSSWLLLDNIKAVQPPVGDIMCSDGGYSFEVDGNELYFTSVDATPDIAIERAAYADDEVTAPANGGESALKVSHANECWPNFRLNFSDTLKAGTIITFDFYGNYDYEPAEGVNKYVKLELTGNSKDYATSANPDQVVWTLVETWNTATITLTAEVDHVDLFYNVADGQHGNVASYILIDNVKAHDPSEVVRENEVQPTCTATGLTEGKHCSVCNKVLVAQTVVPANGHTYAGEAEVIDNVPTITYNCSVCGKSEHKIKLNFHGCTVSMCNNLEVNYYINPNVDGIEDLGLKGFEDISVKFSYGNRKDHYDEEGNLIEDSQTVILDKENKNEKGYYRFTCRYITPSQIGDEITAVISGKFGDKTYTFTMDNYSVKQYCLNRLDDSTSDVEKAMLVDMLYYCDASRAYTTYKANESVTGSVSIYADAHTNRINNLKCTPVTNTKYADIADDKAVWKGVSLYLYDCVRMRFRFETKDVGVNSLKAHVQIGSASAEAEILDVVVKDGQYYVYVDELAAAEMSKKVYVTLYEGDIAVSDTICYSIETYVAAKLYDTNEKLVTLLKAMMCYGKSAETFFGTKTSE